MTTGKILRSPLPVPRGRARERALQRNEPRPSPAHSNNVRQHTRQFQYLFPILLLSAVTLAGCLTQETTLHLRYDPATDTFQVFTLFEHFRSTRPTSSPIRLSATPEQIAQQDAVTLRNLWERRHRMIPLPLTFDGPVTLDLTPDGRNLADPSALANDLEISWSDIRINPGRLFRDRNGFVGYSHEVTLPGRVVDQLLQSARAHLTSDATLHAEIAAEIADRPRTDRPPADWSDLAREIARRLTPPTPNTPPAPNDLDPLKAALTCMDDPSLDALSHLSTQDASAFNLTRTGATFHLKLPLTLRDANGLATVARTYADTLTRNAVTPTADPEAKLLAQVVTLLRQHTSTTLDPTTHTCIYSLDLIPALNAISQAHRGAANTAFAANPTARTAASALSHAVENWKDALTILDNNTDPDQLLRDPPHR